MKELQKLGVMMMKMMMMMVVVAALLEVEVIQP